MGLPVVLLLNLLYLLCLLLFNCSYKRIFSSSIALLTLSSLEDTPFLDILSTLSIILFYLESISVVDCFLPLVLEQAARRASVSEEESISCSLCARRLRKMVSSSSLAWSSLSSDWGWSSSFRKLLSRIRPVSGSTKGLFCLSLYSQSISCCSSLNSQSIISSLILTLSLSLCILCCIRCLCVICFSSSLIDIAITPIFSSSGIVSPGFTVFSLLINCRSEMMWPKFKRRVLLVQDWRVKSSSFAILSLKIWI